MASMNQEMASLEEVEYKLRIKPILVIIFGIILFIVAFLNFFPISNVIKSQLKKNLAGTGCNPDFDSIRFEWLMPKVIIDDLSLPASCFNKSGESLKFNFLSLNYHLINFSPIGLPFRIDTEIGGRPLSIYYVQGIGEETIRLKDQKLVLSTLAPIIGENLKLQGSITIDLMMTMESGSLKLLNLKAMSKDFKLPAQRIQDFQLPTLNLNEFYLEADGQNLPQISLNKFILGDSNSPIRANLKGKISKSPMGISESPMELVGEIALSENFRAAQPLVEMLLQAFPQNDGFYQVKLNGTVGAPKTNAP